MSGAGWQDYTTRRMAMLKGIDNIGIAVSDLKRSIAFYDQYL